MGIQEETTVRRVLLIAALAAVVAVGVFLTWPYFHQEPTVEVIIAAHDLPVGTALDERDLRIIRIPAVDCPPSVPRRKSEVLGHKVIVPIAKGEFILPNRLQLPN